MNRYAMDPMCLNLARDGDGRIVKEDPHNQLKAEFLIRFAQYFLGTPETEIYKFTDAPDQRKVDLFHSDGFVGEDNKNVVRRPTHAANEAALLNFTIRDWADILQTWPGYQVRSGNANWDRWVCTSIAVTGVLHIAQAIIQGDYPNDAKRQAGMNLLILKGADDLQRQSGRNPLLNSCERRICRRLGRQTDRLGSMLLPVRLQQLQERGAA